MKTVKSSELETFFSDSVQTRIESDLCNYPSAHDPYVPAEESWEVNYIEEEFELQDDCEDDNFGVVEVSVYDDCDVQKVTIKCEGEEYKSNWTKYKAREYFAPSSQPVRFKALPEKIQSAFEEIESALPL